MNPTPKTYRKAPCAAVLLFGLVTFLVSVPTQAASVSIGYSSGNSSGSSGTPGVKLTLPAITDSSQSAWQLTSFTWLSSSSSGAHATGRGDLLIFDAALFSPADKTAATVNGTTTGLVAISAAYNATSGVYSFSSDVVLEGGKSYYFLNSMAISTTLTPVAPYDYGFNNSVTITGIERWVVSNGTWASRAGAPNFAATFAPVAVPEPTTIAALIGLVGLAVALRKRRS